MTNAASEIIGNIETMKMIGPVMPPQLEGIWTPNINAPGCRLEGYLGFQFGPILEDWTLALREGL